MGGEQSKEVRLKIAPDAANDAVLAISNEALEIEKQRQVILKLYVLEKEIE